MEEKKMKIKVKQRTLIIASLILLSLPGVLAASTAYYAQVVVRFFVPADATFNLAFAVDYNPNRTISGTTEAAATATTDWISFNFTTVAAENWIQPYTDGASASAQSGSYKPIMVLYNTGNGNERIGINMSSTTGFAVCANVTCPPEAGSCSNNISACTALTDAADYVQLGTVNTGQYMNITLYGNKTASAAAGQTDALLYVNSTI